MVARYVTIGSMVNMHIFDDAGASPYAVSTDGRLSAGQAPTNPSEVIRLADIGVLAGDVVGPAAATDHAVVRFDGVTGKLIQNSLVTMTDAGSITIPAFQTVDGVDISVHAANDNAHHTNAINTKTNDYTLDGNDYTILLDGNANPVTATLPTAVGINERIYNIKCIDDTFLCDIEIDGAEEIDGDNSNFVLSLHDVITIQSDNANWWII